MSSSNYDLINFFDVYGNEKEGWEVNNQCIEVENITITDDATEKEILEYLVQIGFLSTCDRRRVCIPEFAYADHLEICARKGMMPLGMLRKRY